MSDNVERRRNAPSDAQILARLRRTNKPRTAADLGVTANRLRSIEGVVEVGRVHTGKAGRPAILFTHVDNVESDPRLSQERSDDTGPLARSGELSQDAALASEGE